MLAMGLDSSKSQNPRAFHSSMSLSRGADAPPRVQRQGVVLESKESIKRLGKSPDTYSTLPLMGFWLQLKLWCDEWGRNYVIRIFTVGDYMKLKDFAQY